MPIAALAVPTSTWTITPCPRPVARAYPPAMCIAVFSCGQRIAFGYGRPAASRRAISSMIGAWSVPKLQKRYSTPTSERPSRRKRAAVSLVVVFIGYQF